MTTPPLTYRVLAHGPAHGSASVRAGTSEVVVDVGWGLPPTGEPGPAELLAAAFAACLLKNLARTRELIGFDYDDATVEVVARRQDSPSRFVEISYSLALSTVEAPRRLDLVHQNLRKFGTVYNTLAAVCDVHGEVVAREATSSSAGTPAPG
jgi:uncharacterized OsmC-like protein